MTTIYKKGEPVTVSPGARVEIYLHFGKTASAGQNVYSVRDATTGLVIGHTSDLDLRDCSFSVSQAGRTRVLTEQRKNVHATIGGIVEDAVFQGAPFESVWYDPYRVPEFTRLSTSAPIYYSTHVALRPEGVYAV